MPRAASDSDAFNAIGERRRREMLAYLLPQARSVSEIAAALGLSPSSASKHLKVLARVGLVQTRRQGRQMLYRTNVDALRPLRDWTQAFERA